MTKSEYDDYVARVNHFNENWRTDNGKPLHFAVNTDTSSDEYYEFMHRACECCNRPLAGSRYTARTFGETFTQNGESLGIGEIGRFLICVDCMYFNEYGKLDDMTMLDIARDEEWLAAEAEKRLRLMTNAYIDCALWSSTDESDDSGGRPLDENYTRADIGKETQSQMQADCTRFYEAHTADCEAFAEAIDNATDRDGWEEVGHCFWLSRNGHGAGFFDRFDHRDSDELQALGDRLQDAAMVFGEAHLYIGDDEALYCFTG